MSEAKSCPRCRLVNPSEAVRCDCGYDFATRRFSCSLLPTTSPGAFGAGSALMIGFVLAASGVLAGAIIGGVVAGCNRRAPAEAERPIAGYDFEVRRTGGGYTKGHGATFSVQDGSNVTELKDGRLRVNGKGYGAIADGAKIVVDENGVVTINGQARSPEQAQAEANATPDQDRE